MNLRTHFVFFMLGLTLVPYLWSQQGVPARIHIVSVAVGEYQDEAQLKDLPFVVTGVNDFINVFDRRKLIFQKTVLTHQRATRRTILNEIQSKLVNDPNIDSIDMIVFFFSGHGKTFAKTREAICPYDTQIDDLRTLVSYEEIHQLMKKSKARHKLCIIEACRGDEVQTLGSGLDEKELESLGLGRLNVSPGFIFITSSSKGEDSYGDKDIGGFFSYFLAKGLDGEADGYPNEGLGDYQVSLGELFDYVKTNVFKYALRKGYNQTPEIKAIEGTYDPLLPIINTSSDMEECYPGVRVRKYLRKHDMLLLGNESPVFYIGNEHGHGVAHSDEAPRCKVKVLPYYISKHEVTVGEFSRFVQETNYETTADIVGSSTVFERMSNGEYEMVEQADVNWCYDEFGIIRPNAVMSDMPVVHVSWEDAILYCNWLSQKEELQPCYVKPSIGDYYVCRSNCNGYRLPTEVEWEYAAKHKIHPTDHAPSVPAANIRDYKDGYESIAPIKTFLSSGAGLYDMKGNVWELCWDGYEEDFYEKIQKGTKPSVNPIGSILAHEKTRRGGSWATDKILATETNRSKVLFRYTDGATGFRIVRSILQK